MAHPVLVRFNQAQSEVMSNPLGLRSVAGLCLHVHVNICSCISAENPDAVG